MKRRSAAVRMDGVDRSVPSHSINAKVNRVTMEVHANRDPVGSVVCVRRDSPDRIAELT